jgi:hypothetical protein
VRARSLARRVHQHRQLHELDFEDALLNEQSGRSNKLFYTCKLDSFSIARAGNGPPKMSGGSRGCTKIIFYCYIYNLFSGG